MKILRLDGNSEYSEKTAALAEKCSWIAGKHLARLIRESLFTDWECPFTALDDSGNVIGYCTVQKADYYPENRYSPWISCIFVDEGSRGKRVSHKLIKTSEDYLRTFGFKNAYIPSDMLGFYEKCGYTLIDTLVNYGGDTDNIFMKEL